MFMALDEKEMEVVIDAMDEKRVGKGTNVIVQGERGNELYVVEEGELDCFKKFVSNPPFLYNNYRLGCASIFANTPRDAFIPQINMSN